MVVSVSSLVSFLWSFYLRSVIVQEVKRPSEVKVEKTLPKVVSRRADTGGATSDEITSSGTSGVIALSGVVEAAVARCVCGGASEAVRDECVFSCLRSRSVHENRL
jgi:hypothetical protein